LKSNFDDNIGLAMPLMDSSQEIAGARKLVPLPLGKIRK
jgi:hypothetical protein